MESHQGWGRGGWGKSTKSRKRNADKGLILLDFGSHFIDKCFKGLVQLYSFVFSIKICQLLPQFVNTC